MKPPTTGPITGAVSAGPGDVRHCAHQLRFGRVVEHYDSPDGCHKRTAETLQRAGENKGGQRIGHTAGQGRGDKHDD